MGNKILHILFIPFFIFTGCATLRSNALVSMDFSSQPPRAFIRSITPEGQITTQGVFVYEQKAPSTAQIFIKVPPLQGRVVFSNGQLKQTSDFNWYPKEGFFLWKKTPIKDTWIPIDLGEIKDLFGDWPVALDVVAVSSVGVIATRGLIYYRVCDDQGVPCSRLSVQFDCVGYDHTTQPGEIGKCERLSGSAQGIRVLFKTPSYEIKPGAKIYLIASRLGLKQTVTVTDENLKAGHLDIDLPALPSGPTLLEVRADWFDGGTIRKERTNILFSGFDPAWTGIDQPHYLPNGSGSLDWAKPVLSDLMEVDTFDSAGAVLEKKYGTDTVQNLDKPKTTQTSCAFAWQRDSSDNTALCVDSQLKESNPQ